MSHEVQLRGSGDNLKDLNVMPLARVVNNNSVTSVKSTQVTTANRLFQNVPNPTNRLTSIPYYIAGSFNEAHVEVFELTTGRILSFINIYDGNSDGTIFFDTTKLPQGLYGYRLMVDGSQFGILKMSIN